MKLRFIRPVVPLPDQWRAWLETAYEQRWFSNFGDLSVQLEQGLAERYGAGRKVLACASGTAGLTAALLALNVRGRVAMPAFTFPATLQAALAAGLTPVLVDVDADTWVMTPETLMPAWREGINGVLAVRPFGLCHDFTPLQSLCREQGVPLLIDAAAALGGVLPDGTPVGTQGDMEVFSLHATKVFAVGEGGVIFSDDGYWPALQRAINFGLVHGVPQCRAINGKFSEFHAAVGLAMLEVFESHVEHRRRLAARYRSALGGRIHARFAEPAGQPVWQALPMCLEQPRGRELVTAANARGVELRQYYTPALTSTPLAGYCRALDCPNSEALAKRMVCLPLYSDMTDGECDLVIDVVLRAAQEVGCAALA